MDENGGSVRTFQILEGFICRAASAVLHPTCLFSSPASQRRQRRSTPARKGYSITITAVRRFFDSDPPGDVELRRPNLPLETRYRLRPPRPPQHPQLTFIQLQNSQHFFSFSCGFQIYPVLMSRRAPNPAAERAAQNALTIKSLLKLEGNKTCADCKRNKREQDSEAEMQAPFTDLKCRRSKMGELESGNLCVH